MVCILIADIFLLSPLAEIVGGSRAWSDLVLASVLLMGAIAIWGNLWIADVFVATSVAIIGLRIGAMLAIVPEFPIAVVTLTCVNYLILFLLLARRVFAPGSINIHRVQGAVAVFLLVGLIFGQLFQLVALFVPGAFTLYGNPASREAILPALQYYAFVVLTTTGFGDIAPLHPLARSLTLMCAVFGTLFPAILIGRLVSQEILHASKEG